MDTRSYVPSPVGPHEPVQMPSQQEILDTADRMIDKYLKCDNNFPPLTEKMKISDQVRTSYSGIEDCDYPTSATFSNIVNLNLLRQVNRIPLPGEILEQCANLHTEYRMGIFPDICRAWLTIDSDIYLWNYETGSDVAYYDGLNETIVSVGLTKPKADVFQNFIEYLLVLTTPSEILVIGVLLSKSLNDKFGDEQLQLTPDVIYIVPTDAVPITKVFGTNKGRIFLGGRDGCLYELVYQKEVGWWGKRCKKVNHSKGLLSCLVPSFVNSALYEEDAIIDLSLDESRNTLYTLTEKGTVEVFDLSCNGLGMSRVASLTPSAISYSISSILRNETFVDLTEVGKVISIVPLTERDSMNLNLVAITQGNVRLYLTTCNSPRPTTLHLSHIRFPPGYGNTNTVWSMRGSNATKAHSLSGSFLISTSAQDGSHDKLWCLSGDIYVSKTWFSETVSEIALSGKPTAIAEIPAPKYSEGKFIPMIVFQHNHTPDRIAVLTIQGTDIYEKLRPVDVLADLLKTKGGPDAEEVKNLFLVFGMDEACCMSIMLACDHWTTNSQVAEWATRALILYGGEARPVSQPIHLTQHGTPIHYSQTGQTTPTALHSHVTTLQYAAPSVLPSCFNPRDVSTPLGNRPTVNMVETQVVQTSHKHNGLYIYLSRIFRPVWSKKIVSKLKLYDSNNCLVSSLLDSELIKVMAQLYALKLFLQKNTQFPPTNSINELGASHQMSPLTTRTRLQEAQLQERHSLDSLKTMVDHALQVFGLWKILSEHQFHVLMQSLPEETQKQLPELTFRDLVYAGKDLCYSLINNLINMYLNDNTSVDSISNKLREVCPSLFKQEDAACSKANEVLLAAKDEADPEERQAKLRLALKLCKEVAGELELSQVCRQLTQCNHYKGVVELCLERANKLDPNGLAHHFYSKNQPTEDNHGALAYHHRMKTYREVTIMLDGLYNQCHPTNKLTFHLPNGQSATSPQNVLEGVLAICLDTSDDICHNVVYEWLIAHSLTTLLVQLGRPSLERYLIRHPCRNQPPFRDLLWQYYETIGSHSYAAEVLYSLATKPNENIKFDDRLTYLGKAVICMRSDGRGHYLGIFLHELEDLVQVARVQRQILDKISSVTVRDALVEEAVAKLNSGLLPITELYEEFADPFNLWECKLTILECAGHEDRNLIQSIWENIIDEELSKASSGTPDDQMTLVMNKIKSLGLQYTIQSPCFPVPFLVRHLEIISCRLNVNKAHVHSTLVSIGVSVTSLLEIYDRLSGLNERCWMVEGNEFHLVQVIASLADAFIKNRRMVLCSERRSVTIQMHDLITSCLSTLYTKADAGNLIAYLKTLQHQLKTN